MVDEHSSGLHPGEHAVGAVHHLAHVVVVTDAHHHELSPLGRFARRGRGAMAVESDPGERLVGVAVEDGDGMAGGGEMAGHRGTHHAEADEGDGTHAYSLAGHKGTHCQIWLMLTDCFPDSIRAATTARRPTTVAVDPPNPLSTSAAAVSGHP